MPRIVDDLIANPAGFAPDLAEYNFSENGISVVKADWGESVVEAALARQQFGSAVVDRHLPDKEAILELRVGAEDEVDLPTAGIRLQQVVGTWQQRGGWLQRDFSWEGSGKFAGSLACEVKKVNFSNFGGWGPDSPNVVLGLTLGPVWYATEEIESEVFTETEERELIWELSEVLGTAPGLIQIRVKNENESADWLALTAASESWDHPQDATADTTAALAYDAVALTPYGGAEESEREGVKVIRHEDLSALWRVVLGSEILGLGHMTHKGARRLKFRIFDPGETARLIQLRLEWRDVGQIQWSVNDLVVTPAVETFSVLDLGECRPAGNNQWEWRLIARSVGDPGAAIEVARVRVEPTEQHLTVTQGIKLTPPTAVEAADSFLQSAGALTGKKAETGQTYSTLSGGDATPDFQVDPGNHRIERTSSSDTGELMPSMFGRAVGLPVELANVTAVIDIDVLGAAAGKGSPHIGGGILVGLKDENNFAMVRVLHEDGWAIQLWEKVEGSRRKHQTVGLRLGHDLSVSLAVVVVNGRLTGFTAPKGSSSYTPRLSTELLNPNTGGVYIYDENALAVSATRYYSNFGIWVPDEEVVTVAGRRIELCSDGIRRQHPTLDAWGGLTPIGFLPSATPSGLEGRAMRGIIAPSQGNYGDFPDSGENKISAQVSYRPAYHLAREAA